MVFSKLLSRCAVVLLVLIAAACTTYAPQEAPPPPVEKRPAPADVIPPAPKPPQPARPARPAPSAAAAWQPLLAAAEQAAQRGDYEEALALLERAQRIEPNSAEVYLHMARTHLARGDIAQASATAERGLLYCSTEAMCDALREFTR